MFNLFKKSPIKKLDITQHGKGGYSYITISDERSCADCDLYGNSESWPYEGWLRITKEAKKVFKGKIKIDMVDGKKISYGFITINKKN